MLRRNWFPSLHRHDMLLYFAFGGLQKCVNLLDLENATKCFKTHIWVPKSAKPQDEPSKARRSRSRIPRSRNYGRSSCTGHWAGRPSGHASEKRTRAQEKKTARFYKKCVRCTLKTNLKIEDQSENSENHEKLLKNIYAIPT